MARVKEGETVFVSPYTGEQFTSQFAFNDHVRRWPEIAKANGLQVDASKPAEAPTEGGGGASGGTRRRKTSAR